MTLTSAPQQFRLGVPIHHQGLDRRCYVVRVRSHGVHVAHGVDGGQEETGEGDADLLGWFNVVSAAESGQAFMDDGNEVVEVGVGMVFVLS